MRSLLSTLSEETVILDLANPLVAPPALQGYDCKLADNQTLEVVVKHNQGINDLFNQLSIQGILVSSMRNKSNRLEELFLALVENNEKVKVS